MTAPGFVIALAVSLPLAGLAALFALWAAGGSWPEPDRAALARRIVRTPGDPLPRASLLLVLAVLAAAGAIWPWLMEARLSSGRWPTLLPAGAILFVMVVGIRGLAPYMPTAAYSGATPDFRERDRRLYGPLCLILAAGYLVLILRWYL